MQLTRNRHQPPAQQWAIVLLVAGLSAGLWLGWFAWDTEYQYDPATGHMGGPYAVWQGVGAFLCSIVVVGLAHWLLRFVVAWLVIPASFTVAWISTAAATDVTGLWLIGAILVGLGTTIGAALMLSLAAVFWSPNKEHRDVTVR